MTQLLIFLIDSVVKTKTESRNKHVFRIIEYQRKSKVINKDDDDRTICVWSVRKMASSKHGINT